MVSANYEQNGYTVSITFFIENLTQPFTADLPKLELGQEIYEINTASSVAALKDAKKIAKGQDELMRNLLEKLADVGVDCKTVKGPLEQEPTYYLQVEKEVQKDTVYNQTFCEELRNTIVD